MNIGTHALLKYLISITMSQDYQKSNDFVDDQIDLIKKHQVVSITDNNSHYMFLVSTSGKYNFIHESTTT